MIEDLLDLNEEPKIDELLDLKEPHKEKTSPPSSKKSRKKREFANQEETAALRGHRLGAVG
jgi:hypothetical protein